MDQSIGKASSSVKSGSKANYNTAGNSATYPRFWLRSRVMAVIVDAFFAKFCVKFRNDSGKSVRVKDGLRSP